MDIRSQIEKMDRLLEFIENELPDYAKNVLVADVTALVSDRVVQTGKDYTGASFKPYSTKQIPAFRFWGKSRTQAAENKVRQLSKKKDKSGKNVGALSYNEFRKINNLKNDKKNFEFTGEMWRKLGIVRSQISAGKFFISVGGTTSAAQDKIDSNSSREGVNIIEASETERALAEEGAKQWLEDNTNRILGE